jgi:hypothetical protein
MIEYITAYPVGRITGRVLDIRIKTAGQLLNKPLERVLCTDTGLHYLRDRITGGSITSGLTAKQLYLVVRSMIVTAKYINQKGVNI